jgi:hypothetical protein
MPRNPAPQAALYAGDAWAWTLAADPAAYPAEAGVALRYALAPVAGGAPFLIAGALAGDAFAFAAPADLTAAVAPGVYRWRLIVEDAAGRRVLGEGNLEVRPDPETSTADTRSHARRTLDAIEATIEGRASKDADAFTIEGRSITRTPLEILMKLREQYRRIVRREGGRGPVTFRRVRFADGDS